MAQSIKDAKFRELWHSYPRGGRGGLIKHLGGNIPEVMADDSIDDSALRLSVAYNKTGHPLPHTESYRGVNVHDSNGYTMIVSSNEFERLLEQKLGKPRICKSQSDALGRRGVLVFESVPALKGQSHCELWDGENLVNATGDYFTDARQMKLWEVKQE